MATTLKILGQSNPAAATLTSLYAVPAATSAVISTLVICNRSATAATIRVAIAPGSGSPILSEYYIYYDLIIPGNETFSATIGLSLATLDDIIVYTDNATVSFSAFGQEIT